MEYRITQEDINLLYTPEKIIYIKLDLLDMNNNTINSLEGNLISDSISVDSDSKVRRTYECTFHVSDEAWEVGSNKNFWIDRRIAPYVGYKSPISKILKWYKIGTFVLDAPTCTFDESNHTISLTCLDLMCLYDGTRGGTIDGDELGILTSNIYAGEQIRESLIAVVEDAGIVDYNICEFNHDIPYDIEVKVGSSYMDFIGQIIDLYSGYEYFFDIDGVFTVQLTPQLKSEYPVLTSDIINPLVISEKRTFDWTNVKNHVEVYGKNIEAQFVCDSVAGTINAWTATISSVTSYDNGDTYALTVPTTNSSYVTININNLGAKRVYDDNGKPLEANKLTPNTVYCFRYRRDKDNMIFLGQYQAYGYYEETSTDCPFSTTNLGYKIYKVIEDDQIYSDSLCEQRAKYECYLSSWMQDTITLEMVTIPFLSVNQKITYIPYNSNSSREEKQYIVKKISRESVSGTMSVDLVIFSESYPDMDEVYKYMYEGDD